MKLLSLALVALVAAGCNGILPTAPSTNPGGLDMTPYVPTPTPPPPVSPPGPHFAIEIWGSPTATTAEPWVGVVSVGPNINIFRPEMPIRIVTTCGATVQTHVASGGEMRVSCLLPLGTQVISAVAHMADGRRYGNDWAVTVSRAVLPPLEVFYALVDSTSTGNTVSFSVRTVAGAMSYRWDFGDGSTETTMLPYTQGHLYRGGGERRVTATAVDGDGLTMTTGSVVGRW